MKKKPRDLPGQAFLELLRPPKLASTRLAIFASYSADPIVLGGALLNLHARGRDNGGGNKSDFASALEALRDKVRFIVQRGRIHRGRKLPKIAVVLDQLVVEMDYRESFSSWHPKIALVCYEYEQRRLWRLWIGSRNLTMSRDLDLGLVLDGEPKRRKGSQAIVGIDALGARLARLSKLPHVDPDALAMELRSVRWTAPEGIDVSSIDLWLPDTCPSPAFREGENRKLIAISPFLNDAFVATLARMTAKSNDRTLVTTLPAIRKLNAKSKGALLDFKTLSLAAPTPEGEDSRTDAMVSTQQDDQQIDSAKHSGLHAKLFAAIRGSSIDIVAGSANATDRAWSARNAEAVARFTGGQSEIDGIAAIVRSAYPVSAALLFSLSETEADAEEGRLEEVRSTVVELPFTLYRQAKHFTLSCGKAPTLPAAVRLEVGLATIPMLPWPKGEQTISFGEVPLSLQTDLVQFKLMLGDEQRVSWLQRVAVSPPIESERDSAAVSRFLSVAGLQMWLREMLEAQGNAGAEDDWDAEESGEDTARRNSWKHDGFALEDMLSAWARNDHDKLKRVDRMLERYVAAVLAHVEHISARDQKDLIALRETWAVVRDVLIEKP